MQAAINHLGAPGNGRNNFKRFCTDSPCQHIPPRVSEASSSVMLPLEVPAPGMILRQLGNPVAPQQISARLSPTDRSEFTIPLQTSGYGSSHALPLQLPG